MVNYTDKGAVWLYDHSVEVISDLSQGNPGAAKALSALIAGTHNGARVLKRYLERSSTRLSPDEIWTLYHKCCDEDAYVFETSLDFLSNMTDPSLIHANLRREHPVRFVTGVRHIPGMGPGNYRTIRDMQEDFLKRYRAAKVASYH